MNYEKDKTCCFIGHRKINEADRLKTDLYSIIEDLIINKGISTFLFGSRSRFDDLCYKVVTHLKTAYPHISRVYVRAEYPYIDDNYKSYLLERYEDTYFPNQIKNSGKAVYIRRNFEMIKKSDYCICYYDKSYAPPRRRNSRRDLTDYQPKSGTEIAYLYASEKCKCIINIYK